VFNAISSEQSEILLALPPLALCLPMCTALSRGFALKFVIGMVIRPLKLYLSEIVQIYEHLICKLVTIVSASGLASILPLTSAWSCEWPV